MNNEEKENQCTGTNNKPETKSRKKVKKKKKKGRANDLLNSQKDVSHICFGKRFLDYSREMNLPCLIGYSPYKCIRNLIFLLLKEEDDFFSLDSQASSNSTG